LSKSMPAGGPYKAAVGLHEPLTAASLSASRKALLSYCASKGRLPYCSKYLDLVTRLSRDISRARFEDLLFDSEYQGADSRLFAIIRRALEFYADLLAGKLGVYGDRILVKTRYPLRYHSLILEEGEIVLIPIPEALLLASLGLLEPLESNLLKLASTEEAGVAGRGAEGEVRRGEVPKED